MVIYPPHGRRYRNAVDHDGNQHDQQNARPNGFDTFELGVSTGISEVIYRPQTTNAKNRYDDSFSRRVPGTEQGQPADHWPDHKDRQNGNRDDPPIDPGKELTACGN